MRIWIDRAKSDNKTKISVQFLTPRGVLSTAVDPGELLGVTIDTICNQPPVLIRLQPFAFGGGYFVHVTNISADKTLNDVVLEYADSNGVKAVALGNLPGRWDQNA